VLFKDHFLKEIALSQEANHLDQEARAAEHVTIKLKRVKQRERLLLQHSLLLRWRRQKQL
jgi:hypothetical protein